MSSKEVKDRPKLEAAEACSKRPSRREEKREEHVRAIMAAANQLVNEVGYEAMTMDDLAIRAGLSKPTLYQYFHSKQELWIRAVVDRIECGRDYARGLDPRLPAIKRLESVAKNMFGVCYAPGVSSVGPALRAVMIPALKASPEYKRAYGELFSAICDIVDEARAQGAITNGLPTRIIVQVFVSLLRDSEYADYIERGECYPERLTATLTKIVLEGITCRTAADRFVSGPLEDPTEETLD